MYVKATAKESMIKMLRSLRTRCGVHGHRCAALLVLTGLLVVVPTSAASAGTIWEVDSHHGPQHMVPGATGQYVVAVRNVGDANSGGTCPDADCVTVVDTLPAGVVATNVSVYVGDPFGNSWDCAGVGTGTVTCTISGAASIWAPGQIFVQGGVGPPITITVSVPPDASGTGDNTVTVSGGGAADPASSVDPTVFAPIPAGFGIVPGSFSADAFDGDSGSAQPVRQVGAHPFELRTSFDMNLKFTDDPLRGGQFTEPDGQVRNVAARLPRGMIGNPQAAPMCDAALFSQVLVNVGTMCPADSQVGIVSAVVNDGNVANPYLNRLPLYNLVPPPGAVAAFGFSLDGIPTWITAALDPSDYSIVATVHDTTTIAPVRSVSVRLWGVPADAAHDALRFNPNDPTGGIFPFGTSSSAPKAPFLTLSSQCDTAEAMHVSVNSWQHSDAFDSADGASSIGTGCEKQRFDASIHVAPTTSRASSPTGLSFDLSIPQNEAPGALGTPPLRTATVTLPEGMTVSPSSADGLAACTTTQISLHTNAEPACPDASKIGTVILNTPLLHDPVNGVVYLAAQNDNPFGSMLALYIVVEDRGRGLLIKLPGRVKADPVTGQVTTVVDDIPPLPFSNMHLQFKSGPRAPLTTPATCGVKTATAVLTPWNASLPPIQAAGAFTVSGDGAGGPCGAQGFHPGLKAGTVNPRAGKDSPLVTTITRPDGDQELSKIALSLPTGLLGRISSAVLCPEGAANAGTCGEGSLIGTALVAAGPGASPFYISDGRVFLTGPYHGAPFGLSIMVHAKAGPLDLGNVIVRGQLQVDRTTAAVRIVTDALPTILQGIPLQLRLASVTVGKPGFMFNPTSCASKQITGQITSTAGVTADVSSHFQVADCGDLAFSPHISLTVGARHHTRAGVSTPLTTTVTIGKGQANLRSASVAFPGTLNALLPVVNQACKLTEFRAGHCGSKARVGSAVAFTPVLRDPLRGSVYFVKNPARILPDLMIALRGQVDLDVTAKVSIPGGKRLGARFDTIPDAPITKFSLRIVSGRNGPLGTTTNLCSSKGKQGLASIAFRAQNGAFVTRKQRLRVNGCPSARR